MMMKTFRHRYVNTVPKSRYIQCASKVTDKMLVDVDINFQILIIYFSTSHFANPKLPHLKKNSI